MKLQTNSPSGLFCPKQDQTAPVTEIECFYKSEPSINRQAQVISNPLPFPMLEVMQWQGQIMLGMDLTIMRPQAL